MITLRAEGKTLKRQLAYFHEVGCAVKDDDRAEQAPGLRVAIEVNEKVCSTLFGKIRQRVVEKVGVALEAHDKAMSLDDGLSRLEVSGIK